MAYKYNEIAPDLIDAISEADIITEARIPSPVRSEKSLSVTVAKKKEMLKYFKWYKASFVPAKVNKKYHGKGIKQIAQECGLETDFVKKCYEQYMSAISEVKSADDASREPFVNPAPEIVVDEKVDPVEVDISIN